MIPLSKITTLPKGFDKLEARLSTKADYILNGVVVNKGDKSGKGYNVEMHMDTPNLTQNSNVKVSCTCPDFQFRWAYVLYKQGALLNPKLYVLEPPKVTNPDMKQNACKHIHLFAKYELDKVLRGFHKTKGEI